MAGVKADDSEGIDATLGEEAATPVLSPPNGRAVLLYAGLGWLSGLVCAVLGAG